MKVSTIEERNKRRSNRLQKKLHVGKFEERFIEFTIEFPPSTSPFDYDLHDAIIDSLHVNHVNEVGCIGCSCPDNVAPSSMVADILLTYLPSRDGSGNMVMQNYVIPRLADVVKKYNAVVSVVCDRDDDLNYPEED